MFVKLTLYSRDYQDFELFKVLFSLESNQIINDPWLSFISDDTKNLFGVNYTSGDNLNEKIKNIEKTFDSVSKLRMIWTQLLIDAIHFLRINDCRESSFLKEPNKYWTTENKSTISNQTSDTTASMSTYGIEELRKYFEQFTAFESILYGSDRHYRDHVQHPIRVWIIGLNILKSEGTQFVLRSGRDKITTIECQYANPSWPTFIQELKKKCKKENKSKCDDCVDKEKCDNNSNIKFDSPLQISTAELAAMWTIIALTHDLGYPLEKVERVNDQLEKMLNQFGNIGFHRSGFSFQSQHDHLVSFLLNVISSVIIPNGQDDDNNRRWKTHPSPKYLSKFSKSWEMFDHGIVSSLILLRSLTYFLETDFSEQDHNLEDEDARQFSIRGEILHAIAAHTTPKVYHLSANTLPFLLVLCDELQEWGRPTMGDLKAGCITGSVKTVTISYCDIQKDKSTIHCKIEYDDEEFREQRKHAYRISKNWHERLRPAVYDLKRIMDFKWEIAFGGSVSWNFILNTSKGTSSQVEFSGPNKDNINKKEIYNLYEEFDSNELG